MSTIESSNSKVNNPIFIPWRFSVHFNVEDILQSIENVLNCNKKFLLGETFIAKVNISECIWGQGCYANDKYLPSEKYVQKHINRVEYVPVFLGL